MTITVEVPATPYGVRPVYELMNFFSVVDDKIYELNQIFAIVAEIGADVPTDLICFQTRPRFGGCGRCGTARIEIIDNDCKLKVCPIFFLIITVLLVFLLLLLLLLLLLILNINFVYLLLCRCVHYRTTINYMCAGACIKILQKFVKQV